MTIGNRPGPERSGGRGPREMRPVSFTMNVQKWAEGSCVVRFGDTEVLCAGTIAERVPAPPPGQGHGWVPGPDPSRWLSWLNAWAPWPCTPELPWGSSRPGPNLYTNSVVKLNPDDGKIIWYRQVLPHDVYDWDLQLPPILTKDGDRDLVLAAGKLGYVVAVDARGSPT